MIDCLQGLSQSHKINSHLRLSLLRVVGLKAFFVSDKGVSKKSFRWVRVVCLIMVSALGPGLSKDKC